MAIKLNPNTADYFYYRGMAYENMGEREEALRDFTSAIKLDKNFVAAYISRASTYYGMGKYQEALDDLTEYIKRKPAADAYEGIAKIYRAMADQEMNIRKKAEYQKKADENFAILEQIRRTK
jgi:tetratricopeptide (TPR) repeat protein